MENGPPETMENAAPGAPAEGEAETASPHAGVVLTTPAAATSPAPVQGPLLATGTTFEGTLAFDGRVVIAGTVRGDVVGDDLMELTETGEIRGNVEVGVAVIAGLVTGDLIATRAIELRSTARVKGDLTTPSMLVEKGAIFDGRCRMDTRPVVPDAARATAYTSTP
jgi:cytoskeletal protein CcmA (bactofilin family)